MSDTFDHLYGAMDSRLNDLDEGYSDDLPDILPKKIVVTHFGKNLISDMTQAHLENSIKFVISKNSVLDDYQKELIKVMTNRVNELKNKVPVSSFTIIDNKTGEVIFEC